VVDEALTRSYNFVRGRGRWGALKNEGLMNGDESSLRDCVDGGGDSKFDVVVRSPAVGAGQKGNVDGEEEVEVLEWRELTREEEMARGRALSDFHSQLRENEWGRGVWCARAWKGKGGRSNTIGWCGMQRGRGEATATREQRKGVWYGGGVERGLQSLLLGGRLGLAQKEYWHFLSIWKFSNELQLIWLKDGLTVLENFQIKYGVEGFEDRDNFLHIKFFRFEVCFEWKFIGALWFELDRSW
jgi:hypothetical protein